MQLSKVGAQLFVGEFNSAANFLQLSNILILMIGLLVPFFLCLFYNSIVILCFVPSSEV